MSEEILATVSTSPPRRWLGIGVMATLGALLLYVAFAVPPGKLLWQAFLIGLGLAALGMSEKTRRGTEGSVELTKDGLRDSNGEVIATLDQIVAVDRGMFAMKPSNGFLIRLKTAQPRRWLPGLWWRLGRRVGIGGVTPGPQTKAMAQMLEILIAERNQASDQTS